MKYFPACVLALAMVAGCVTPHFFRDAGLRTVRIGRTEYSYDPRRVSSREYEDYRLESKEGRVLKEWSDGSYQYFVTREIVCLEADDGTPVMRIVEQVNKAEFPEKEP